MKKRFAIILILALTLTGCIGLAPDGPESLISSGNVYKTGFYGTLFPHSYELTDEPLTINEVVLNKIRHNLFELFHADIGSYSNGTIYCAEKDYKNAFAFYNHPQNYTYYCILGVETDTQNTTTIEIPNVDTDKFDALLAFADRSNYDPFDTAHNAKIEKIELPMPDDTKDIRLIFYKESVDHLFISSAGSEYYILNDQLYLVYRYDFGHGLYEKLIAVKVPEDLSAYFVEFMKAYM